jgi:hypothetical protein
MRYKPKSIAALQIPLGGLPDKMRVELETDIGASPKTVGELRNTWAGRGAQPVWLREKLMAGAKLEDFAVHKTAASRKSSPRKAKKRRKK